MSEETGTKTQGGSGTLTPEKRQNLTRMVKAITDGMAHGLMKKEDRERAGDFSEGENTGDQETTFEGTNVPISVLFMYFASGKSYKDLLETHPTVKEDDVLSVIEATRQIITNKGFSAVKEMIALRKDVERLNQNSATNFKKLAEAIKGMLKIK